MTTMEMLSREQMRDALVQQAITVTEQRSRSGLRLALALLRSERRLSDELQPRVRSVLDRLGTEAGRAYLNSGVHSRVLAVEAEGPSIPPYLVDRILTALASGLSGAESGLRTLFESHWERVTRVSVDIVNAELSLGIGVRDDTMNRLIAEGGKRAGLVDFKGPARDNLFAVLAHVREEGLGPLAAARRIREMVPAGRFVDAGSRYRAQLIARAETLHAQRRSTLQVYKDADTIRAVQANDALLGDTDDECMLRDGEEFSFADAETATAETHPQCTLNFTPVYL